VPRSASPYWSGCYQQQVTEQSSFYSLLNKFPLRILNLSYPEQTIKLNTLLTVPRHKRFKKETVYGIHSSSDST